jgi:hypothetical protein
MTEIISLKGLFILAAALILFAVFFILYRRKILQEIDRGIMVAVGKGHAKLHAPSILPIHRFFIGKKLYDRNRRNFEGKLILLEPLLNDVNYVAQNNIHQSQKEEPVYFTGFYPRECVAGEVQTFVFYMHLSNAIQEMKRDLFEFIENATAEVTNVHANGEAWLKFGSKVVLIPSAEGITFNPPFTVLWWSDALNRESFHFWGEKSVIGKTVEGKVDVFVGLVQLGSLPFSIKFVEEEKKPIVKISDYQMTHQRMWRNIIACFDKSDDEAIYHLLRAIAATQDPGLIESVLNHDDDNQEFKIRKLLKTAESFQLLWSEYAAQNKSLKSEIEMALYEEWERGVKLIHPVYWNEPCPEPQPLPKELFSYIPIKDVGE